MVFCLLLFLPLQKSSQQFSNLEEKKIQKKKPQQKRVCVCVYFPIGEVYLMFMTLL